MKDMEKYKKYITSALKIIFGATMLQLTAIEFKLIAYIFIPPLFLLSVFISVWLWKATEEQLKK